MDLCNKVNIYNKKPCVCLWMESLHAAIAEMEANQSQKFLSRVRVLGLKGFKNGFRKKKYQISLLKMTVN